MLKSVNICRGVRSLIILTLFYCGLIFPGLAAEARAGSDFNGDGRDDVVVGVPGEDVGSIKDAGAVQILYGGVGRTPSFDQVWHLNRPDVPLECGAGDRFGSATATGDFDNDGYDDLAVGIPFKNNAMGQVLVLYGGAGGLSAAGAQAWDQNQLQDKAERGDRFGAALVVGDFDANGYDDLAVGVPGEDFADEAQKCADGVCTDAGVVNLIYGGPSGLAAAGNELWHQDRGEDWDGWVEWGDCFGASLAAGDFDNNRADDLAVGALCEHTGGSDVRGRNHGAVSVYYGAAGVGLTGDGTQYLRQWADRVAGDPQADDAFGYALAAGDLNGDGYDDLIVGVPGEEADTGQARDAGAVQVFYGQAGTGLGPSNTERNELLSREALGLGRATAGMQWGKALAAGNFNRDRFVDVAVGAPLDDVGSAEQGGSVSVLFGSATGFLRSGNQLLTQDTPSVSGTANSGDWFGYTLTAGDLDDDGVDDLAVGVPFENIGEAVDAGAVNLFYGAAGVGLAAADNLWLHQGAAGLSETAEAGDQFGGRWVPELHKDPWPRVPTVQGGLTPQDESTQRLRIAGASVPVNGGRRAYLIDGQLSSFWVNGDGVADHAWFEVSLASAAEIGCLKLATRPDWTYRFDVLVDGRLIGTFITARSSAPALQAFTLPAGTTGRTVRLQCTDKRWFRVQEVELWGGGGAVPEPPPSNQGGSGQMPGSCGSQLLVAGANVPERAARSNYLFDGELSTFWVNGDGVADQAWFEVSLASAAEIGCLKLATRPDLTYQFNVLVDGRFVGAYTKTRSAAVALQAFALPAGTSGRTVRLQCTNQRWFKIQEVELWGAGGAVPEPPPSNQGGSGQMPGSCGSQLLVAGANVPERAARSNYLFDGELSTFWVNGDGVADQAWFEVSLASAAEIGCLKLATRPDLTYQFNVLVDGRFVGAYTKTRSAAVALQAFALPAGTSGRTVRLQCTNQHWFRVQEVELWGAATDD